MNEIKEFKVVDKKFLEVTYVNDCKLTRIDLEALFGAKVVEEKNEQNCSNKELDALKRLEQHENVNMQGVKNDFRTIEKALKRLEELEKAFVALSKDDEKAKKLLSKEIEKNRALEIIKPLVHLTKDENGCWLWLGLNAVKITQEQYDSLKEVLKDE